MYLIRSLIGRGFIERLMDIEARYEILMQALFGENLIHDVGYIESGLTASWDAIWYSHLRDPSGLTA